MQFVAEIMVRDFQERPMLVLMVGPSGVGKSELSEIVALRFPNIRFFCLDDEVAKWAHEKGLISCQSIELLMQELDDADFFLCIGLHLIRKLAKGNPDTDLVIDVGGGFLDSAGAGNLHHAHAVVAVTADPEVAHERIVKKRSDTRTLKEYREREYSISRQAVYGSAHRRVETTGRTPEESTEALAVVLVELLRGTR